MVLDPLPCGLLHQVVYEDSGGFRIISLRPLVASLLLVPSARLTPAGSFDAFGAVN